MRKRVLSLALALALCLGLLPTAALAATYTELAPCKYDNSDPPNFSDGLAAVRVDSGKKDAYGHTIYKWGFIDETGKEVVPCKYDNYPLPPCFSEGLAVVKLDNKRGFVDKTGKEVIPCKYDYAYDFSDGLAAVGVDTGEKDVYGHKICKWGFIDKTGNEVIPCKYDYACDFSEGLAAVKLNNKWGFIDKTGKEVVPCKYSDVQSFSDGLAAVKQIVGVDERYRRVSKWGFVDKTGAEVIPLKYDEVESFDQGRAKVSIVAEEREESGYRVLIYKHGFIDKTGAEVIPCKYNEVTSFSEGLMKVALDGKWGFVDETGKEAVPCKYLEVRDFSEGLAAVELDGKWGFVDKTGREVVPCKFREAKDFSEGLAAVRDDEKYDWGFIDKTGKEVVPYKYFEVKDFSEGLAAVSNGDWRTGKWGFVDKTGAEVIPLKYDEVDSFSNGCAAVVTEISMLISERSYIDKTGKEVSAPMAFSFGLATERKGGGVRLFNAAGQDLPLYQYDYASILTERLVAVRKDGKWGMISVDLDAAPEVKTGTAYAATQTVNVDGKPVEFRCYALRDAKGGSANYIRLRDLAILLNGTAAQFEVGWDGIVTITTKRGYTPNGSELYTPFSGNRAYTMTDTFTKVNGKATQLAAFVLSDDAGGGYTYYQLRDLGQALGFNVGWGDQGIFIETDKPYDPSN